MSTESLTPDTNPEPTDDTQEASEVTSTLAPDALQRELEKARKEAAKYRTRLREREEAEKAALEAKKQAEMTAEERAKAAEAKAKDALAAAEARILTAERKAALAGKLTNVDRVMRLMDDQEAYFDGGTPDVDAIIRDFPEYAPNARAVDIPGSKSANQPGSLKPEDFKGKSEAWIAEHLHLLKAPPR
ncbi:MAG TPA: hypothetical protein VIG24_19450 [Acidimicrobiia bacterium]